MDLCLNVEDYILNIRVGALIKKENKVLVHHSLKKGHVALPGGRIKLGEDSISALKREIKEELGKDTRFIKTIGIVENFFEVSEKKYHEYFVIHELEFCEGSAYEENLLPKEEDKKDKLEFLWYDLDTKSDYEFVPNNIIDIIIKNEDKIFHYIGKNYEK